MLGRDQEDERERTTADASKSNQDGTKTRVASRSWDELGGFLLTVRAVSGVDVA